VRVPDLGLEVLGVIGVDPLVRRVVANRGCVVPRCVGSDVVRDASKAVGVLLVTVTCDVRCGYLEHLGNTHVRPRVGPFDDDCLEVRRELAVAFIPTGAATRACAIFMADLFSIEALPPWRTGDPVLTTSEKRIVPRIEVTLTGYYYYLSKNVQLCPQMSDLSENVGGQIHPPTVDIRNSKVRPL
jgi:hypothetical protein